MSSANICTWTLACILATCIAGCGENAEVDVTSSTKMVYVDSKTMQPVVAEISAVTPVEHPTTGKRTLNPALYCVSCKQWHPVPPTDQINRVPNAAKCLKTGTPLTANGPWPK